MRLFQVIKYSLKYRKRTKKHIARVQHFYFKLLVGSLIPSPDIASSGYWITTRTS